MTATPDDAPRTRPVRVVLADDEAMIRAGVCAILAAEPGIEVVAEAADGHEAVELTLRHRPDVVLLDVRMPRFDGLRAAEEIQRVAPDTAVVMLTTFSEDEYIARALDSGASGFLLKAGDPRELIAGVRAVADGAACLSPEVARRVIARLGDGRLSRAWAARRTLEPLTRRERDVVALVADGLSNAEVAERLHVVEGTVKAHVSAVLARLGLRNRVELAILVHEAGPVHRKS
ncbi:response regulator [Streptomyces clavuligerus]|uniref:Two component transcriptional regulator, LuxR family n=1 Tax=Streptomyces clavuligerus TaxID=1901 RepID=E2Q6X8_STRCL|nr:response regulator transcription factor [Streptomyces clavuligerus]ANW17999.1 DNA-binding response regulator [Streptomyces clavuligerus]AXU12560.1 DNA-binding response regulator [Streptomyces clavuligerus]EFG09427.1 Two component transcriptional regulator, LuxR family [Streptomyces clavuligerus]MBY6302458.1 response regulator transcription factor [Streptomyces clavuligerus]QCS05341.1 DNA-binding response regulator [Streptomyces clavuligerus]